MAFKKQQDLINAKLYHINQLQETNKGKNTVRINVLMEVDSLLEEEDLKWKQSKKQTLLKEGDINTKFFRMCANKRRKTNNISSISDGEGHRTHTHEEIYFVLQCYFQYLFAFLQPSRIEECLQSLAPIVTKEMNDKLLQNCTATEVEVAVFQMNPLSSPGPDGFPVAFYQNNW